MLPQYDRQAVEHFSDLNQQTRHDSITIPMYGHFNQLSIHTVYSLILDQVATLIKTDYCILRK
jgi:hypothetical protein